MKRLSQLLAIALALVLMAGCSVRDENATPDESAWGNRENVEEEISADESKLAQISPSAYAKTENLDLAKGAYLSVIGKTVDTEFWQEVKRGALQAGDDLNAELGYEGDDVVKVGFHGPAKTENVDEQVNLLDEELDLYPAALAISIVDATACEVQFDLARENDIPIVAFDSGSSYDGIEAMISTDNAKAAKECAKELAENAGEEVKLVLLAHDSKSESALTRTKSFLKTVKEEYPNIEVLASYSLDTLPEAMAEEINQGEYSLDDSEPSGKPLEEEQMIDKEDITTEQMLDYIFAKNPDVTAIHTTNAESFSAVIDKVKKDGKEGLYLSGYDMNKTIKTAIEDGTAAGSIVQNPYGMGYAAVIAAARAALNLGNEAEVDTGYVWADQENMNDEAIQNMLYE